MSEQPIRVNLGTEGGILSFPKYEEFLAWFTLEKEKWVWAAQSAVHVDRNTVLSNYNAFVQAILGQIGPANQLVQMAKSSNTTPNLTKLIQVVWMQSELYYGPKFGVYSNSPRGRFIFSLKDEQGPSIALSAMGYINRTLTQVPLQGAMIGFLFENGFYKTVESEKAALVTLHNEWRQNIEEMKAQVGVISNEYTEYTKTFRGSIEESRKFLSDVTNDSNNRISGLITDTNTKLSSTLAGTEKELEGLRKTYDVALATKSPVTYWTAKARSHLTWSVIFAILTIVVGGFIFYGVYLETLTLIVPPKGLEHPELWHPEYWRLGLLVSTGLFGVWVVRIIVRLFLSNVHLQTDAKERVIMVQTYLALIRRGKLSTENEHFILTTLFRPSTTGIMKDDGVPLTALEALSKLGKSE
jgi:Family of unknown function (DUF6161)